MRLVVIPRSEDTAPVAGRKWRPCPNPPARLSLTESRPFSRVAPEDNAMPVPKRWLPPLVVLLLALPLPAHLIECRPYALGSNASADVGGR